MTHSDLIDFFGSGVDAAKALGVDRSYVSRWRYERIPSLYQSAAMSMSRGRLTPDEEAKDWMRQYFPNGIQKKLITG